ncbi:MAG TPA: TonB-dependent receptor [Prevotella sp.]|nr:TonB-dependent receptor [Prevotella sp.]
MINRCFVSATIFIASLSIQAMPLKGIVKDKSTGEPLVGTIIKIKEYKKEKTSTGLDGTFLLKDLPDAGTVTLLVNYLSYKPREITVDLSKNHQIEISMEPDAENLDEIVIKGQYNSHSNQGAISLVKNSSQILNVMSRQTIQLSPDINVASALQRISGVTMESDASGQAAYAILRGMDKRYNYTLVNGIKISSPDDQNRYIPLNLFPSDLMDRLVVSKSLTADMEGDAAGGVVDMDMKDAPSHFQLQTNMALGYSDFFFGKHDYLNAQRGNITKEAPYEQYGSEYKATMSDFKDGGTLVSSHAVPSPNMVIGLSAGNRFWNNRLGILLAGNIQNEFRGTERTFNTASMPFGEQAEVISKLQNRLYSIHDLTAGIHFKIDLNLAHHKLEWYNMYINRNENTVRYTNSIVTDYGYEPDKGDYTRDDEIRTNTQTQSIFASHLKGTHHFGDHFTVDWSGVFSRATEKDPDRTYVDIKNTIVSDSINKTVANSMERRFQHNTDKSLEGYLNLNYDTPFSFADLSWKAGAMYSRKRRENRYYSYQFNPQNISATLSGEGYSMFKGIDWYCRTPYAQASQLNYNSHENIGAVYAMLSMRFTKGEIIAGFRGEHTNQLYTMLQTFKGMGSIGEQSYWDWLPSASLKWSPTGKMNVRLNYYKSINRPSFYEIVPYEIDGEEYEEKGNPELKRARIDNIDARWEWFPSATEQVLFGVFYKYLKDPIEMSFYNNFYMPQNLGNAKNIGMEIDLIKYIRHFGIKANYTYTHSSITTTKRQYKVGSAEIETISQTRPLVNQAPHTANLSLLYKDTEHGWNGQLASSYTGSRIAIVSPYKDADEWERGLFSLDFSAEKKFKKGWSVFLKANNLTNAVRERYLKTVNDYNAQFPNQKSGRTIMGTYKYGRTFLLGIRYDL